ncbi:MAG: glycosyltransferase family 39 protein [Acidobacteriaceae bacterium]
MPPAPATPKRSFATPWYHSAWFVFAIALVLRFALIFNFHLYRYASRPHNHFQFGWEMGRVASSIASGHGFGNPFYGQTGPTAWVTPLYPYLMAGVFRLFGIYSDVSALVMLLLNALFGALVIFPMRSIAARCFSRKVAVASIWTWAVWPFAMDYVAHPRDTFLTALLFTCAIALTLRIRAVQNLTLRPWILLGLLWGALAISDPTLLLVLPPSILWLLAAKWRTTQFRSTLLRASLACLLVIACMAPWMIRNARVFHTFIPLRSDFGCELYLGNGPGSNGRLMIWDHPDDSPRQYALYRSMGEVAYCHMRGRAAIAFIRRHPAHFFADTLRRVFYFWFGHPQSTQSNFLLYIPRLNLAFLSLSGLLGLLLALRNRAPGVVLIALAFLFFPLTYYAVVVNARFLFQLTPLLYILTLYLWTSAEEGYRVRILSPTWWRTRFAPHT